MANTIDLKPMKDFCTKRKGPAYVCPNNECLAFICTKTKTCRKCKYPNIKYHFEPLEGSTNGFTIKPILLRPKSAGCVTLRDDNPFTNPMIHANFLHEDEDVETFVSFIF